MEGYSTLSVCTSDLATNPAPSGAEVGVTCHTHNISDSTLMIDFSFNNSVIGFGFFNSIKQNMYVHIHEL